MSPNVKFAIKCVLFALGGAAASLQQALPGISQDELYNALLGAVVLGVGYAGIGYATTLEAPGKKQG